MCPGVCAKRCRGQESDSAGPELLQAAQDSGEWPHRGQPAATAGRTAAGSRPASEAAARTISSRCLVVLRAMEERGKPRIAVSAGGAQHPRTVRGYPDLRPFPAVRRKIEHRVAQRNEGRIPCHQSAIRIPRRPDGGERLLEARDGPRPVHPVGLVAFRSPVPMPRIARPRVSRCSVAAARAVTAGSRPASAPPWRSKA
jgi:hypothetical protein